MEYVFRPILANEGGIIITMTKQKYQIAAAVRESVGAFKTCHFERVLCIGQKLGTFAIQSWPW